MRRHAPPDASSNILSIERGPSVVLMMSATACAASARGAGRAAPRGLAFAAAMLPYCAFLPVSRFVFWSAGGRRQCRTLPVVSKATHSAQEWAAGLCSVL